MEKIHSTAIEMAKAAAANGTTSAAMSEKSIATDLFWDMPLCLA
jgi:hypothetical protein